MTFYIGKYKRWLRDGGSSRLGVTTDGLAQGFYHLAICTIIAIPHAILPALVIVSFVAGRLSIGDNRGKLG